ncbi:MAG: hypothetical protein IJ097_02150 [Bacilli bacterium]|nr:hypothetical protein [Bacilli bacterium]
MKKVFLYLYPIEEFTKMFLFHDDRLYDELGVKRPLPILNETINKRYREQGYEIVYALYPDKEIFGIEKQNGDKVIYTDIIFDEASVYDSKGNEKRDFAPKYPSEKYLIDQLGDVEHLVVGGYHFSDCVKRVAEFALQSGIDVLIDIDMTDLFFNLYKQERYFEIDNYNPERYREHMINRLGPDYTEFEEEMFNRNYSSPVYGFNISSEKKIKN